tara:strand:+ start:5473 stop:6894 length:1422 start_codon:yes stop_codon:yes gene_type:complete
MSKFKKKEIAYKLIKSLYKNKNSLSVTLAGSYSEHFNINKAGDVDIIIICKKLNKAFYDKCILTIKRFKDKYFHKRNLIINSTFGPIKFYKKNSIVFHLMIYDLKSHIQHTIKSPFTCYDWERSQFFIGKGLNKLSPVYQLQYRDFLEARRSIKEYLEDLSQNRISYREYLFEYSKVKLIKKYFKIDELNKRDFIYHVIKFLIINYIKYEKQSNIKVKNNQIEKKFSQIVNNKLDLNEFIKLKNQKYKKKLFDQDSRKLAIKFIKNFNKFLKRNEDNKIYFSRHKETKLNKKIFLGQKLNPVIIDKKNKKEFKNITIKKFYSSPAKRCIDTAKIIGKRRKIIVNKNLKEIDYGDAEGLSLKKLSKKFPLIIKKWKEGLDPKFPNGENTYNVSARLNKFIDNEIIHKEKSNTLIVTHNVVLRCLIGKYFSINKKDWHKININYFDLLEFKLVNRRIVPNIERKKYLYIFKNFFD